MRITILTWGGMGDVRPYIGLALGLKSRGHDVLLTVPRDLQDLATRRGIECFPMMTDVQALLRSEAGRGIFDNSNRRRQLEIYRKIMPSVAERILQEFWQAAQGTEAIVYHVCAIGAQQIAEKLRVPAFLANLTPSLRATGRFPHPSLHARLPVGINLGSWLNRLSFRLLKLVPNLPSPHDFPEVQSRFRREVLRLPSPVRQGARAVHSAPVAVLYYFSPHVIRPPDDWDTSIAVTGYWFLPFEDDWRPSAELENFLDAGPPPVYVGFGSMASDDPQRLTEMVMTALRHSGQRGLIDPAWGGMVPDDTTNTVFPVRDAPHDWLFPRVSAVVHHGGTGTMMSALRHGRSNVLCPFSTEQTYWSKIAAGLGVAPRPIAQRKLSATKLAKAIRTAVTDGRMAQRTKDLGTKIRNEDGVAKAVKVIERVLAQNV